MTFEGSKQSGSPHHFFALLAGNWAGTSRLWLEPGKLTDESPVVGSIQLVLNGRFALYLYQGSIDNEPQHGMFTFGFNTMKDRYEASWVDSWHNHTSIMFCTGSAMENGFQVLGSYPDPNGGPDWGWRTEVQLLDEDHLLISAYNISPEGGEAQATEAALTRVKK
jgi:hypothetical protein